MKHASRMAKIQAAKTHRHPALDVARFEDQSLVSNDRLEICIEVLQDQGQ